MDLTLAAAVLKKLRIEPPSRITILEARELTAAHVPPFPPDIPALILGIESAEVCIQIRTVLLAVYPPDHKVHMTAEDGGSAEIPLQDLGRETIFVSVYVPSLGKGTSFEAFAEIVAHLRAPDGCPWDREQTHHTLRTHLLEESYEALSAMDEMDSDGMREEFGDLLLQIVLNSQIGNEAGSFSMTQVLKGIYDKIVRRHPHVFGDVKLDDVDGVLLNWEKLKEKERGQKKQEKGLLDGVPAALPALTQALEFQDRAARVGFDWPEVDGVLDKIREEIEEIKQAQNLEEVTAELGDLFFVLVNLARWRKVDAESALRATNLKFKKRFAYVERGARAQGRNLTDLTLAEMDEYWNAAKRDGL